MTDLHPSDPAAWLAALGMDMDVTAALIDVAFWAGAEVMFHRYADALPMGVRLAQMLAGPPDLTGEILQAILVRVREAVVVPPSPDVAEAMGSAS